MISYYEKEIGDWTIRELLDYLKLKQGFSVTIKNDGNIVIQGNV